MRRCAVYVCLFVITWSVSNPWYWKSIYRLHLMQTTATNVPVCQFVCHAASLGFNVRKNGWTDRRPVWGEDWESKEHCVRRGSKSPRRKKMEAHSMQPLPSYFGLSFGGYIHLPKVGLHVQFVSDTERFCDVDGRRKKVPWRQWHLEYKFVTLFQKCGSQHRDEMW